MCSLPTLKEQNWNPTPLDNWEREREIARYKERVRLNGGRSALAAGLRPMVYGFSGWAPSRCVLCFTPPLQEAASIIYHCWGSLKKSRFWVFSLCYVFAELTQSSGRDDNLKFAKWNKIGKPLRLYHPSSHNKEYLKTVECWQILKAIGAE